MLSEEVIDKVIERLTRRIEQGNIYILEQIGKSIKKIGTLSPSKAQQLIQLLRYGGDYDKIVNKISEITELNVKDIYKIFEEVAKNDYNFAKQFYEFRNKKFIPYENNIQLRRQVKALADITAGNYRNLTRTLAFAKRKNGKVIYTSLSRTYQEVLDKAVLNVFQGKTTFQDEMYSTIKELVSSGLKTVDYDSNRSYRLDSAIRMQMKDALRTLHNNIQEQVGEEIGADGVEVSVHSNPAPDHAEVQGRQFSNEEFEKFQNDIDAVDYTGKLFPAEFDGHDRRSISQYNCYHYTFAIILGVNKPEYTDEQLQQIIDNSKKKFKYNGKEYTKYEGTQLQRQLELEMRKAKDEQIGAKASGMRDKAELAQARINKLAKKYNELTEKSGLLPKVERARVSGYSKILVNKDEIGYARKHNQIWHSTRHLEDIIKSDKIISPSIAVGKKLNNKVKYGHQFIEFKPEVLENVDKSSILYKGDGGNKYTRKAKEFDSLMDMLKDEPNIYNELKLNDNINSLKYIKRVYIRQDEPQYIIDLLKENKIPYKIYKDYRIRK